MKMLISVPALMAFLAPEAVDAQATWWQNFFPTPVTPAGATSVECTDIAPAW